jgi:SAM-dependent methyltransferase
MQVAWFYDRRKVGDAGCLGFRRSSDLTKLLACLLAMMKEGLLVPGCFSFLDMGCGDGRVNVLLSYLTGKSVGVELDEWTLDEYAGLRRQLNTFLTGERLPLPHDNIFLFHGDTTDPALQETISREAGIGFDAFDVFYTYLTMQEEFGELIARKARKGALFMVYGLESILPRINGLRLLAPPLEGILALYQKA